MRTGNNLVILDDEKRKWKKNAYNEMLKKDWDGNNNPRKSSRIKERGIHESFNKHKKEKVLKLSIKIYSFMYLRD